MRVICRVAGSIRSIRKRLFRLTPHHLATIAAVARRVERLDKSNQWVFAVILPDLVKDSTSSRQLVDSDERMFTQDLESLLVARAKHLIEEVRPRLITASPGSPCVLNEGALLRSTTALLREGVSTSKIADGLLGRLRQNPEDCICGFDQWLQSHALRIYQSLRRRLEKKAPLGFEIDEDKCLQHIRTELRIRLNTEGLAQSFLDEFKVDPTSYIRGYKAWLRTEATTILTALSCQRAVKTSQVGAIQNQPL